MKIFLLCVLLVFTACSDQEEHPMQTQMRTIEKAEQVDQMMQGRVDELNQKIEQ